MSGTGTARLRVTLLGAVEVRRGDTVLPVSGARLRGLLVRLALAGGRTVDPGVLVDALWPEDRPADPANALQSLVSRLRRMLGAAGAVTQAEGGYRLGVGADDVDVLRLERLAAAGRDRLRAGAAGEAVAPLAEAAGLRDDLSAVAAVAPAVATRLAGAATAALTGLAEAELALGRAEAAAGRLTALHAERPTDERVAALLMDALAAQGRQAEALDLYERVRRTLADRLGADPGAALRERHLRLLRSTGPVRAEPGPGTALPAALTSFIGRDDDLTRIDALLSRGRLVTVVGPGGAGKTRLAVEAGRRHRHEYRDGTWLVDLASVTEPAKVGGALLAAIGLRGAALFEVAGRRHGDGDELDLLADQLNGRESLLVVDNCEHLVDAVAHLLATLLPRCAGLRVLATSREPLAIDGEALVPLGPLTLPEPGAGVERVRRAASVRLFTDRAAAVRPGFDVDEHTQGDIVRVVRALDGMPLALELAAARLRTLALTDLAAGLSDRFRLLDTGHRTAQPRHRTLRAVIAWSWDLLGADERTVAQRVSVLPGGVTAESAAAVCPGLPAAAIPGLLAALVDRSLLQLAPDPGRHRMLETLREYGIERLAEEGTLDTVRGLAARHFADLVARHDPRLRGPGQLDALRVLRAEYDNALAALRHLSDHGDSAALALAMNLCWFWQMLGRHPDAAYWLGEALAGPVTEHTLERDCAEAMHLLNRLAAARSLTLEAMHEAEPELRALAARLLAHPDLPGFAGALATMTLYFLQEKAAAFAITERMVGGPDLWLSGLAQLLRAQFAENDGDLDQVRGNLAGALECFAAVGDRWGMATGLPMRALLRQYDGDLDGASSDLTEARARAREFGSLGLNDELFIDMRWIDLHMRRGDQAAAVAMLEETRDRAVRAASPELTIVVNALEAGVWLRLGEVDRARERLELAEAGMPERSPVGGLHGQALVGAVRASLCVLLGDHAGAGAALARAYAAAIHTHDRPILSIVTVAAAGLAESCGRPADVAFLLGAAARLRGAHDRTEPYVLALTGRSRAALGEDAFAAAYRSGWQLDAATASARVDPARLRFELPAQARRA